MYGLEGSIPNSPTEYYFPKVWKGDRNVDTHTWNELSWVPPLPQIRTLKPWHLGPQKVTVFGNGLFTEVIKVKCGLCGGP